MDNSQKIRVVSYDLKDALRPRVESLFDRISEYGQRRKLSMCIMLVVGADEENHSVAKLAGGDGANNLTDDLVSLMTFLDGNPTVGTAMALRMHETPTDDTLVPFRTPHDFELELVPLLQELRNLGDENNIPYIIKVTTGINEDQKATYLTYVNDPGPTRTPEVMQFALSTASGGIEAALATAERLAPLIVNGLRNNELLRNMILQNFFEQRNAEEEAEETTTH